MHRSAILAFGAARPGSNHGVVCLNFFYVMELSLRGGNYCSVQPSELSWTALVVVLLVAWGVIDEVVVKCVLEHGDGRTGRLGNKRSILGQKRRSS